MEGPLQRATPLSPNDETDSEFVTDINGLLKDYTEAMDSVKIRLGLQTIMPISARQSLFTILWSRKGTHD